MSKGALKEDPYKIKGKVEVIKGVEVLEPGYKQENGPEFTTIEALKEAGFTGFKSRLGMLSILSEDDFESEEHLVEIERWFDNHGMPMFYGMSIDKFVETFGKDNINIGDPSKDIYTKKVWYDTVTLKVNGDGIGLYQTYLNRRRADKAIDLTPFTLDQITQFIP